jgi:hypothetical protein
LTPVTSSDFPSMHSQTGFSGVWHVKKKNCHG